MKPSLMVNEIVRKRLISMVDQRLLDGEFPANGCTCTIMINHG